MSIDISKLTVEEIIELKAALARFAPAFFAHPKQKYNWASVDWSKRPSEIARELGCHVGLVYSKRHRLGIEHKTKNFPACKEWDWSKSNPEISAAYGVEIATARYWRSKLGKAPVKAPGAFPVRPEELKANTAEFYSGLDWTKRDIELSWEVGVTRERIRQWRVRLGKAKVKSWVINMERFKEIAGNGPVDTRDPRYKMNPQTVRRYASCMGLPVLKFKTGPKCRHPWEKMNWDLPNSVLAEIWGIRPIYVGNRRCTLRKGKPKFYPSTSNLEEWRSVIAAEEKTANENKNQTKDQTTQAQH